MESSPQDPAPIRMRVRVIRAIYDATSPALSLRRQPTQRNEPIPAHPNPPMAPHLRPCGTLILASCATCGAAFGSLETGGALPKVQVFDAYAAAWNAHARAHENTCPGPPRVYLPEVAPSGTGWESSA